MSTTTHSRPAVGKIDRPPISFDEMIIRLKQAKMDNPAFEGVQGFSVTVRDKSGGCVNLNWGKLKLPRTPVKNVIPDAL